jgi:hypothetical protein
MRRKKIKTLLVSEHTEILIRTKLNLLRSVNKKLNDVIKENNLSYDRFNEIIKLSDSDAKLLNQYYERDLFTLYKYKRDLEVKFREIWQIRKNKSIY